MLTPKLAKFLKIAYVAAIGIMFVGFTVRDANRILIKEVTIEAGESINIQSFFNGRPDNAEFVTDISLIDTDIPATYNLKINYNDLFNKTVTLNIVDTTSPKGYAIPQEFYTIDETPQAADCVGGLYDLSGIASVEYEYCPDTSTGGDKTATVKVTDPYGNTTLIDVPFTVIDDHIAPLIIGADDIYTPSGSDIDFASLITVTDDYDEMPLLRVDTSELDIETAGRYPVTYIATDNVGNTRERTVYVTVWVDSGENASMRDGTPEEYEEAYALADKILEQIAKDNDVATARAIFNYVHYHVTYVHSGANNSIPAAAIKGFTTHRGNCFVFYSCCKILLDRAGIDNIMVQRDPAPKTDHYWNLVYLNGKWYHCDATPFVGHPGVYFMLKDSQLDSRHRFNGSLYPERAGGSTHYLKED
ncbi:MAG: hypothetical protein K5745_04685 [Saccharofermentans sp.]|nr:hypothetical protein [Saccharofermentans sp.]